MPDLGRSLHIKNIYDGLPLLQRHCILKFIAWFDSFELMRIHKLGELIIKMLTGVGVGGFEVEAAADAIMKNPANSKS